MPVKHKLHTKNARDLAKKSIQKHVKRVKKKVRKNNNGGTPIARNTNRDVRNTGGLFYHPPTDPTHIQRDAAQKLAKINHQQQEDALKKMIYENDIRKAEERNKDADKLLQRLNIKRTAILQEADAKERELQRTKREVKKQKAEMEYQRQIDKQKDDQQHELDLLKMRNEHEKEVRRLRNEHEMTIAKTKDDHETDMMQKTHEHEKAKLDKRVAMETDKKRIQLEDQIHKLEVRERVNQDPVIVQYNEKLAELNQHIREAEVRDAIETAQDKAFKHALKARIDMAPYTQSVMDGLKDYFTKAITLEAEKTGLSQYELLQKEIALKKKKLSQLDGEMYATSPQVTPGTNVPQGSAIELNLAKARMDNEQELSDLTLFQKRAQRYKKEREKVDRMKEKVRGQFDDLLDMQGLESTGDIGGDYNQLMGKLAADGEEVRLAGNAYKRLSNGWLSHGVTSNTESLSDLRSHILSVANDVAARSGESVAELLGPDF